VNDTSSYLTTTRPTTCILATTFVLIATEPFSDGEDEGVPAEDNDLLATAGILPSWTWCVGNCVPTGWLHQNKTWLVLLVCKLSKCDTIISVLLRVRAVMQDACKKGEVGW
jgi:hypothetical protein